METKIGVWNWFLVISALSFMVVLSTSMNALNNTEFSITGQAVSNTGIPLSYNNIEKQLASNIVVKKLPSTAIILLRFYNFNTGERQWEKSYVIKRASVKEGSATNPDITIILSSKYLSQMTSTNFCEIIKKAKANNDLGIKLNISRARFIWKYKSMFGYRGCFGF